VSIVHLLVSVDKISHKSREKVLMKLSVIIKIAGGLREIERRWKHLKENEFIIIFCYNNAGSKK